MALPKPSTFAHIQAKDSNIEIYQEFQRWGTTRISHLGNTASMLITLMVAFAAENEMNELRQQGQAIADEDLPQYLAHAREQIKEWLGPITRAAWNDQTFETRIKLQTEDPLFIVLARLLDLFQVELKTNNQLCAKMLQETVPSFKKQSEVAIDTDPAFAERLAETQELAFNMGLANLPPAHTFKRQAELAAVVSSAPAKHLKLSFSQTSLAHPQGAGGQPGGKKKRIRASHFTPRGGRGAWNRGRGRGQPRGRGRGRGRN